MTDLALHLAVFLVLGAVFLVLPLVAGWFVRPDEPSREKQSPYECGEPTIGSSYLQFDSRYYVVALLFIVFDVEIAFFFPWAKVFGTAVQLADHQLSDSARGSLTRSLWDAPASPGESRLTAGGARPVTATDAAPGLPATAAYQFAVCVFVEMVLFFGLLLLGYAYVWKMGGLDWVRSTRN